MRICIPTHNTKGLDSLVHNHFGKAPYYIIYNTSHNMMEILTNPNKEHGGGKCDPSLPFTDNPIDVAITSGKGKKALRKLKDKGVKTFGITSEKTVAEVIESIQKNALSEIEAQCACSH